jgi:ubiquinone/menaquinone biosynthesis C-methylase UbiE
VAHDRDVLAFEERASRYDEGWLATLHHDIVDRTVELAVQTARASRRILDIGSGTGYLLGRLAERLGGAVALVGVDPAQQMVAAAQAAATDPRVSVVRGVAEQLPFSNNAFDLVVSTTSFDHWQDQQSGLRECARVLVAGGQLVLTDQFSNLLLPTLVGGRRHKARTQRRASNLVSEAGFRSQDWHGRFAAIMRTVTATK